MAADNIQRREHVGTVLTDTVNFVAAFDIFENGNLSEIPLLKTMNCCWVVWWTLQSSNSGIVQCD